MTKAHRICYDRILPGQLFLQPDATQSLLGVGQQRVARAVFPRGKRWPVGSTLRVRFMAGTQAQKDLVRRFAPAWSECANLNFAFDDAPQAEIRITFDPDDGAWSYIGTDCSSIPLHAATMNLGWQDEAVILHEFGHAIGLAHEHQNPSGGIVWKDEVVIRDLGGPPNFWDPETVRHNVLEKYTADQINGTAFDAKSIMLYAFPGTWTQSGQSTHENTKLSDTDKAFIASTIAYPGRGAPERTVVELSVAEIVSQAAAIAKPGEEDVFSFKAIKSGRYVVETDGLTDVALKLFGPNSRTAALAEDDDSGDGSNARIAIDLVPGTYYAQVRHYDSKGTGEYSIRVFT